MASAMRPCLFLLRQTRPALRSFQKRTPIPARHLHPSTRACEASQSPTDSSTAAERPAEASTSTQTPSIDKQDDTFDLDDTDEYDMGDDVTNLYKLAEEMDDGPGNLSTFFPTEVEEEKGEEDRSDGYFGEGEEEPDAGDDYEFQPDDITSAAHEELEQIRELRELERAIVWDMPLLYQYRKEALRPSAARPLRWKYNSFLGDTHAASSKVVLSFQPSQLTELSQPQQLKLKKLLGPRYNPIEDVATMSSDVYPTVAQNKRSLGELFEKLRVEAKDPTDMFEDIPLDMRHVKPVKRADRAVFPDEWKLRPERVKSLKAWREQLANVESRRIEAGEEVEGRRLMAGSNFEEEFVSVRRRRARR